MLRWDISLHPSWDRMYMSGMTVREISDFTGRPRSTVHRHLQVRETYANEIRALHDAARTARGPDWPTTHWQRSYKAAQIFLAANGRLPVASGDETEQALAKWISTQRSLRYRAALPAIQVTLMDMIPGWDERIPRTDLDDHWRKRLAQLQMFVTESCVLPRYKRHASEHERVLGVWLHTQHQARAEGRLLPRREEALDEVLPSWHSSM